MQIAVIGAGLVGVATAHELAVQGHELTVFERRNSVAEEASFAPPGLLGPGHLAPWAGEAHTRGAGLWRLCRGEGPVTPGLLLPVLRNGLWWSRWWRGCEPRMQEARRQALGALASLSLGKLQDWTRTLNLDPPQSAGCLVLLRSERSWRQAQAALAWLQAQAQPCRVLTPEEARVIEPGLNPATSLHGAVQLPNEALGNGRHLAQQLRAQCAGLGVHFRLGCCVRSVRPAARPVICTTQGDEAAFDAVVMCAGSGSPALLRGLGLRPPMLPVVHHTVTLPLRPPDAGPDRQPRAAVLDAEGRVQLTRLGQRLRVTGRAQRVRSWEATDAAAQAHSSTAVRPLYRALEDWFPGSASLREAQHAPLLAALLPDGLPLLGSSGHPGIWLNTGHGANAWALAAGSAQVLAALLVGRAPMIDPGVLHPARFDR